MLAVSSADDRASIYDLSVEPEQGEGEGVPDQMMFLHYGPDNQKEIV